MERERWVGGEAWRFDGERWVPQGAHARKQVHSYRDLDVFNLAYTLAMELFRLTACFPKEERYALVDQMRRSSRGVCGNQADEHQRLTAGYDQVSAMLWTLMTRWETY